MLLGDGRVTMFSSSFPRFKNALLSAREIIFGSGYLALPHVYSKRRFGVVNTGSGNRRVYTDS